MSRRRREGRASLPSSSKWVSQSESPREMVGACEGDDDDDDADDDDDDDDDDDTGDAAIAAAAAAAGAGDDGADVVISSSSAEEGDDGESGGDGESGDGDGDDALMSPPTTESGVTGRVELPAQWSTSPPPLRRGGDGGSSSIATSSWCGSLSSIGLFVCGIAMLGRGVLLLGRFVFFLGTMDGVSMGYIYVMRRYLQTALAFGRMTMYCIDEFGSLRSHIR